MHEKEKKSFGEQSAIAQMVYTHRPLWLVVPDGPVGVFQKLLVFWVFYVHRSCVYAEWCRGKKKILLTAMSWQKHFFY